jgi:hypothetical protein
MAADAVFLDHQIPGAPLFPGHPAIVERRNWDGARLRVFGELLSWHKRDLAYFHRLTNIVHSVARSGRGGIPSPFYTIDETVFTTICCLDTNRLDRIVNSIEQLYDNPEYDPSKYASPGAKQDATESRRPADDEAVLYVMIAIMVEGSHKDLARSDGRQETK